jgi:RNA polymerase sigma factor (TIGR02999 family)
VPQEQAEELEAAGDGSSGDQHSLFVTLYEELRRLARRELRRRGPGLALGATTLLHELYLNLQPREGLVFPDRERFLAYTARAMRGLIIDYARRGQALKRGSGFELTSLRTGFPEQQPDCSELQNLSNAIERLASVEPHLAQVVDLKYFGGLSLEEIAAMSGVSERTVQRNWKKARLFLHRCLSLEERPSLS